MIDPKTRQDGWIERLALETTEVIMATTKGSGHFELSSYAKSLAYLKYLVGLNSYFPKIWFDKFQVAVNILTSFEIKETNNYKPYETIIILGPVRSCYKSPNIVVSDWTGVGSWRENYFNDKMKFARGYFVSTIASDPAPPQSTEIIFRACDEVCIINEGNDATLTRLQIELDARKI